MGNKRVTQTSDSRSWTPSDDVGDNVGDHMFNTVHAIKGLHFTYQLSAIRHGMIHSKKGGSTQINMYISRYQYSRYILRRLVPIEAFEDTKRYGGSLRDPKEDLKNPPPFSHRCLHQFTSMDDEFIVFIDS